MQNLKMIYPLLLIADVHVHERRKRTRVAELKALIAKLSALWKSLGYERKGTLVILGDLYDRNSPVGIDTTLCIAELFNLFERVIIIVGNHDTPIRSTATSLPDIYKMMGNVMVVKQITAIEDCAFVPYFDDIRLLVANGMKYRYIFAHKDIKELNQYCDPEYGVGIGDFPPANAVFNGHLHSNAAYKHGDGLFIQVGAPYPTSWADKYETNRFCYVVTHDGHTPYYLNITADEGAPDAAHYSFTRSRDVAGKMDDEQESILVGLQELRDDDMSISEALRMCGVKDKRVNNIIRSLVSNAPQTVDAIRI